MKSSWSIFRIVAIAMAGILGLGSAYAQSTNSGDIRGIVTDPSGALIPGATVSVLNLDTGVAKDFPTNNDGLYDSNADRLQGCRYRSAPCSRTAQRPIRARKTLPPASNTGSIQPSS